MIHIADKHECCGCAACAQVCPAGCISMKPDGEGFWYPVVEESSCIGCDACDRVCPVLNASERGETVLRSVAAYVKDSELREQSSSGGLFSLLADTVLDANGVVYGAAFEDDFSVAHRRVESAEDLAALRGSKYLQSRTETTFRDVQEDLKQGRPVLFSGTACQVSALQRFLGEDCDRLVTVDVLCHGVPSPGVWQAYLREAEKMAACPVKKVSFRSKTTGWKQFALRLEFEDGTVSETPFPQDPFMQLFLRNAILRPSCHACPFKALERDSDLTLGDAWGVDQVFSDMDDDRGTSIALVHTEKGMELLESVASGMVWKAGDPDVLLPRAADSRKSVMPNRNRDAILEAYDRGASIAALVKRTEPSFLRKVKRKLLALLQS